MSETRSGKLTCDREQCVNNRDGYCSLKNPEREGDRCLHYEDIMNALRLEVNVFRGTLGR